MRVIVIGAGAIGLMAALRLAERGADVLVFESEPEGFSPTRSASRAAAGMLGPLSETLYEHAGTHPRLLELGLGSLALWRERGAALGLSTFPARGAVLKGYPPAKIAALIERAKQTDQRVAENKDGLHLLDEGALDPAEALGAITHALKERGGKIRYGADVRATGNKRAVLDDCAEQGDVFVVATGAWSGDLAPSAPPVTPVKGHIMEMASDFLQPGQTVRNPHAYAVGRAPGVVVVGATMEPGRSDLEVDPRVLDILRAGAGQIDRDLAHAKILRAWAGVRPMTTDWAPRVGRAGEVIIACGHSRNGWLLAPITAEMICAYVFGDSIPDLWAAFAP